ncbi:hypothetical protein GGI12_005780, partial [Dipsacomyces acuminosporus]
MSGIATTIQPQMPSRPGTPLCSSADIAAHHYSETADFQRMRASLEESLTQGVSKVLVIYTGGTIGMKHDKRNGYSPVKGFLPARLREISRFHDPDGFNDFDIEFHRTSSISKAAKSSAHAGTGGPETATLAAPVNKAPSAKAMPSTLIAHARQRLKDMS